MFKMSDSKIFLIKNNIKIVKITLYVKSFMMLFKNELPPLFFEIFAYIHFLTFLSVFPPFPHTHTEIASLLQSGRLQALRVGLRKPVVSS